MRIGKKYISKTRLALIFIIIVELFVLGLLYLNNYALKHLDQITINTADDRIISFSVEAGIYDHSVTIELKNELGLVGGDMIILYSIDGSDPYYDNQYLDNNQDIVKLEPKIYTEPITIDIKNDDVLVVPIKAVIYNVNNYSRIVEKTYIVSDGDIKQYIDLPIVSITANPRDLYDYYVGIEADGYVREDVKDNPNVYWCGNYCLGNQIDSKITIFNNEGRITNYNVKMSVSGNTSMHLDIKSYTFEKDDGYIEYEFKDSRVKQYEEIKVRSGSQDRYTTNIRSAVTSKLCHMSGFDGCIQSDRALVYRNGVPLGVYDVQDNFTKSYIASKFDLKKREVVRFKGNVGNFYSSINDFESEVDIDNLLMYYSLEILLNNTDWPINNFGAWKYTGKSDKNNKYTDGKWRFFIFDTDIIWYDISEDLYSDRMIDNLADILVNKKYDIDDKLFHLIINNDVYKEKLLNTINELKSNIFSADNIANVIDSEYNKIEKTYSFLDSDLKTKLYINKNKLKNNANNYINNNLKILNDLNS